MATLVLTVVGTAIGGPIGGAIGAIVGQQVDAAVFRPKGREGPRLSDLSVQTSSYGTQIPKIFGSLRVAGSVIWSTDLIETRSRSSAGKGQPSVTSYSYSASFAVLLSARPIIGVGRIWADGKLLRGAAGDFKTATDFRVHMGGGDQPIDPLIAAAEGAQTPAHRGSAYVVFEQFQLADYGNRIPSLTFEVIADAGPVTVTAIATALSDGIVTGDDDTPLPGFSAYGDSVRAVVAALAEVSGAWFVPRGSRLAMRRDGAAERTLDDAGFAANGRGARGAGAKMPIDTVPKTLVLNHYDPARDYQTGVQRATRPGAGDRSERREIAASLAAEAAKAIVETGLARLETECETRTIETDWAAIDLPPGAVIAITGESGRWRVTRWSLEAMVLTLDLVRLARAAASVGPVTAGRVLASPDVVIGTTLVEAFELPPLDDVVLDMPRIGVAAAGSSPGWRRAALLFSLDGGNRWESAGGTALPAVMGHAVGALPEAGPALRDLAHAVEVDLANDMMMLADANDAALDAGANTALLGDEILQFGTATPLGGRRWRLSRLLRARRGSEAGAGAHAAGERFVLLDPEAIAFIPVPVGALGGRVMVLASGVGDVTEPARADALISGASILPPAPVHLRTDLNGTLQWARRSRSGWRWADGGDVPLVEEREAYRITLGDADVETATPSLIPAPGAHGKVAVRQLGTFGASAAATGVL